jgi:hypothetical protein
MQTQFYCSNAIYLWFIFFKLNRISQPYSFTADALDVFLRITAPTLHASYGRPFLDILMAIKQHILPKLQEDDSKNRLSEFLREAVDSRNPKFVPFFKSTTSQ